MSELPAPETDGQRRGVTSGDFNGDGYPDLARDRDPYQCGFEVQLSGAVDPALVDAFPPGELCAPIAATLDFNVDHIDDLAVLSRSRSLLTVVLGRRDFDTGNPEIWRVDLDEVTTDFAVGDIDHSGFDDIILSDGTTFWGSAALGTATDDLLRTSITDQPVVLADHDADGDLDILCKYHWFPGLLTEEPWDTDLQTEDGDAVYVAALAR